MMRTQCGCHSRIFHEEIPMGASIDTDDSVDASDSARDAINEQFQELFDGVEDLIKRVADVQSPEIQKIRAKARVALMMAKSAIQDGATHVGSRARRAAGTTDEYLREYPWYALGAGTLLGFALGVLVARSRD
jgi:ElaB protein